MKEWLGLFLLSFVFVAALEWAHLPAALLLGPMVAAIAVSLCGQALAVPRVPFLIAQATLGCMIARSLPVAILGEMRQHWPLFFLAVFGVIAVSCTLGWGLARLRVLPGTTAVWGAFPGAASAMIVMAEAYGADARLVAFMQYLRVFLVAVVASLVSSLWAPGHGTASAHEWFPRIEWKNFAETLLFGGCCLVIALKTRIQAGPLLLPMFAGMLLQNTGLLSIELPPWMLAISYGLIGWSIGLRFTRPILLYAARALPKLLASILSLIAICGVFAVMLHYFAGIDPLTAYLATSPGGADSVAIIAAASKVDMPFVMALQTARFMFILLAGPRLARYVSAHAQ